MISTITVDNTSSNDVTVDYLNEKFSRVGFFFILF